MAIHQSSAEQNIDRDPDRCLVSYMHSTVITVKAGDEGEIYICFLITVDLIGHATELRN